VTEFGLSYTPQTGKDSGPSYYDSGFPRDMRAAYEKKWHEENDPKLGQEPMLEAMTFRGPDFDDMKPHFGPFSRRYVRASPSSKMRYSAITQHWPAIWLMSHISGRRPYLGMRLPKASRAEIGVLKGRSFAGQNPALWACLRATPA
jgi:hypothetical protein